MKFFFKYLIHCLGLGRYIRYLRYISFIIFDSFADLLFYLLRVFRLLPAIERFDRKLVKNILIIRLDRIGDVILSTPAIRAVRETFPEAKIHLLVCDYTKDLVVNNKNIDKLLMYKRDRISDKYDLAIAFRPWFKDNYLTFASKARFRLGYAGRGGAFFLTHKLIDDRAIRIRHEVESALELVGMIGCTVSNKDPEVSVTQEGERFAEDFLLQNKINPADTVVIIHPGAVEKYIRWEKEGFAAVADRLIKEVGSKVILTGDNKEHQLLEETVSLMTEKPILASGFKLTQLISLIKRCNLFIGNSSGPMHIAAALRVPVVATFGNIHPLDSYKEWGPWGEGNIVISKNLDCLHCHPSDCWDYKCMKLITPEEVFSACMVQLKKAR